MQRLRAPQEKRFQTQCPKMSRRRKTCSCMVVMHSQDGCLASRDGSTNVDGTCPLDGETAVLERGHCDVREGLRVQEEDEDAEKGHRLGRHRAELSGSAQSGGACEGMGAAMVGAQSSASIGRQPSLAPGPRELRKSVASEGSCVSGCPEARSQETWRRWCTGCMCADGEMLATLC